MDEADSPAISRQGDGMNPDYVAFIWFALVVFVVWVLFLVIILFVHYDYERCANNEKAGKGGES
jgi:hypothetical protein